MNKHHLSLLDNILYLNKNFLVVFYQDLFFRGLNFFVLRFISKILNFDNSTSLSARYIDGVKDTNSLNPINFSSYSYLDMNFSIDFQEDLNLTLGINNIFDKVFITE